MARIVWSASPLCLRVLLEGDQSISLIEEWVNQARSKSNGEDEVAVQALEIEWNIWKARCKRYIECYNIHPIKGN